MPFYSTHPSTWVIYFPTSRYNNDKIYDKVVLEIQNLLIQSLYMDSTMNV